MESARDDAERTNDQEESSQAVDTPDRQDGGPGSHSEDDSGGATNDVASGGTSADADDDGPVPDSGTDD